MDRRPYKVAFATGSRADYGIVRNYISKLNADPDIDLSILVTGALLDQNFGHAIDIIREDGFCIGHECQISLEQHNVGDTIHLMAEVLDDFGRYFQSHHYDLIIILGDRYEIYSIAIAAAMQRQHILHIHGGEITLSNYDEFIRHSITKMSRFHFTSTEEYRHRVIQLGENPKTVFNLGALGAENCLHIDMTNVPQAIKQLKNSFCVLFHPETLNEVSPIDQIQTLLDAIEPYTINYPFVFIGANADTSANIITTAVKDFCSTHQNCMFYANLHPDAYHYLVKHAIALIGNSSSGIIEAPSLGTYTINIGDRQTGRVKSASILDTKCVKLAIRTAINYAIDHQGQPITDTPYYKPHTAERYYEVTKQILHKRISNYKEFYDIDYQL